MLVVVVVGGGGWCMMCVGWLMVVHFAGCSLCDVCCAFMQVV